MTEPPNRASQSARTARRSIRSIASTAAIAASTDRAHKTVDAFAHHFRHTAAGKRDDRRSTGKGLGHDDAEWFFPANRHQQRRGLAEKPVFRASSTGRRRNSDIVDVRRDPGVEIAGVGPSVMIARDHETTSRRRGDGNGVVRALDRLDAPEKDERCVRRHCGHDVYVDDIDAVEDRPPSTAPRVWGDGE